MPFPNLALILIRVLKILAFPTLFGISSNDNKILPTLLNSLNYLLRLVLVLLTALLRLFSVRFLISGFQ